MQDGPKPVMPRHPHASIRHVLQNFMGRGSEVFTDDPDTGLRRCNPEELLGIDENAGIGTT